MSEQDTVKAICWAILVGVPINLYFVWHGWVMNRSVDPRSPVLRALLWVKVTIWLMNLYFAIIAYRTLADLDPVLPFGGIGLGLVVLFVLTAPGVVHSQMVLFMGNEVLRRRNRDADREQDALDGR